MAYWMPAFAGMTGDGLEPLLPSSGAAESEKQVFKHSLYKTRKPRYIFIYGEWRPALRARAK